ncbi:MAG: phage holin family protein [Endomicrobia bacterium]|nr:phage holin family protein [Endomicrobiia bacterium]
MEFLSIILKRAANSAAALLAQCLINTLLLFLTVTAISFANVIFLNPPAIFIKNLSDLRAFPALACVITILIFSLKIILNIFKLKKDLLKLILFLFVWIGSGILIYFTPGFITGFYVKNLYIAFYGALLFSCINAAARVNFIDVDLSLLPYNIKDEEDYGDFKTAAYEKKTLSSELEKIQTFTASFLVKYVFTLIILIIAAALSFNIHVKSLAALSAFPVLAFIITGLSATAKPILNKTGYPVLSAVLLECLSFGICAFLFYFIPEFIAGFYTKNLGTAYMGAIVFSGFNAYMGINYMKVDTQTWLIKTSLK